MNRVVLIGMMACGKSTVGRILSKRLHRPFIDTDSAIEQEVGCTISHLFETKGEAYFRDLETKKAKSLSGRKNLVVATGGGMILAPENREYLRENATVIFLKRPIDAILESLDNSNRPLAQDGREAFIARYESRLPLYLETAHVVVDTSQGIDATIEKIMEVIQ